eukprot:1339580-Amorphochlora_amoeboformis.AAC.1
MYTTQKLASNSSTTPMAKKRKRNRKKKQSAYDSDLDIPMSTIASRLRARELGLSAPGREISEKAIDVVHESCPKASSKES